MKIIWRLPNRTGGYWQPRQWPIGYSDRELSFILAKITSDSEEAYTPHRARNGGHGPLRLLIAKYEDDGMTWSWLRSERLFTTIPEAKDYAIEFLGEHPNWLPPKLRAH